MQERECSRWRKFDMNMASLTDTGRDILCLPDLDDDGQERDEGEVVERHTALPRRRGDSSHMHVPHALHSTSSWWGTTSASPKT